MHEKMNSLTHTGLALDSLYKTATLFIMLVNAFLIDYTVDLVIHLEGTDEN